MARRTNEFVAEQPGVHHFDGARKLQDKLVENWAGEAAPHTRDLLQLGACKSRFGQILLGQFAQAGLSEKGHVDCGGEGEKSFVRADIRGGLFAADMLLARREGENEAAATFGIEGLARETARELANKFIARGDHSDEGPAITWSHAQALTFHGDDIGFGRRLHDPSETASVIPSTRRAPPAWANSASCGTSSSMP